MNSDVIAQRQYARQQKMEHDLQLLVTHQKILAILNDPKQFSCASVSALQQISLWERSQLCSPFYIRVWRRLLTSSRHRLADFMCRPDALGGGLASKFSIW